MRTYFTAMQVELIIRVEYNENGQDDTRCDLYSLTRDYLLLPLAILTTTAWAAVTQGDI